MGIVIHVFLPVILGGYLFIRFSPIFYYTHYRLDNQRVIMNTLTAAFVFFTLSVFFNDFVFKEFRGAGFITQYPDVKGLEYATIGFSLSLVILFVSLFLKKWKWFMMNRFLSSVYRDNDGMELLFADAFKKQLLVSVTLHTRKVYIGSVISSFGSPSFDTRTIRILPFISGYRHPDTHELKITTWYDQFYEEIAQNEKKYSVTGKEFEIALPVSGIQSVSFFDQDLYQNMMEQKNGESEES